MVSKLCTFAGPVVSGSDDVEDGPLLRARRRWLRWLFERQARCERGAGGGGMAAGGGIAARAAVARVAGWTRRRATRACATEPGRGAAAVDCLGRGRQQHGPDDSDGSDARIYERMVGGFTPDTRVAIASASKMVSGLVLFDAVRRGELTLDSTTGGVLRVARRERGDHAPPAAVVHVGPRARGCLHAAAAHRAGRVRRDHPRRAGRRRAGRAVRLRQHAPAGRGPHGRGGVGQELGAAVRRHAADAAGPRRRRRLLHSAPAGARNDEPADRRRPARVDERVRELSGAGLPPRRLPAG